MQRESSRLSYEQVKKPPWPGADALSQAFMTLSEVPVGPVAPSVRLGTPGETPSTVKV